MRWGRRSLLILAGLCGVGIAICFSDGDSLTSEELKLLGTWRRVDARDARENGLRVVFAEKRWSRVEILNVCSKLRSTYFRPAFWRIEEYGFFWSEFGPPPRSRRGLSRPLDVLLGLGRPRSTFRDGLGSLEFLSRDRIRISHSEWMLDDAEFELVTDPAEFLEGTVRMAGI